jgi:hypothetical protein
MMLVIYSSFNVNPVMKKWRIVVQLNAWKPSTYLKKYKKNYARELRTAIEFSKKVDQINFPLNTILKNPYL